MLRCTKGVDNPSEPPHSGGNNNPPTHERALSVFPSNMFNNDFSKMFDPQQAAQAMQKLFDMNSAMSMSKQNMEVMKKVSSLWADTLSTCTEKQFKYAQSSMEDCIETMRELSTAKGMDDYMQKQAKLSQKVAEKAQVTAQDMAQQWQKTQAQCTDMIGKQMMQGMEWSKQTTSSTK